jgi:RNA polymerase sigma-70 factor (ECF subfamily)
MVATAYKRCAEADLIDRLRGGDEGAFVCLVNTYSASLKRVALAFVSNDAVAEEVVQETWLAVLTGLDRFEGRSTIKTWIFKILTNRAKTRAIREKRTIAFSALEDDAAADQPAVDPARFLPASHAMWPGHWASPPEHWSSSAEDAVLGRETMGILQRGLESLPPAQRMVVALRDVHGWPAAEVCDVLGLSEANQRVLLHRGRSRLRGALEVYFAGHA